MGSRATTPGACGTAGDREKNETNEAHPKGRRAGKSRTDYQRDKTHEEESSSRDNVQNNEIPELFTQDNKSFAKIILRICLSQRGGAKTAAVANAPADLGETG